MPRGSPIVADHSRCADPRLYWTARKAPEICGHACASVWMRLGNNVADRCRIASTLPPAEPATTWF